MRKKDERKRRLGRRVIKGKRKNPYKREWWD
jgi:hypothetical protein